MAKPHKQKKVQAGQLVQPRTKPEFALYGILILAFFVFYRCIYYAFLSYDDLNYITDNSLIKDFSGEGIKRIFTTPVIGMYNPLPMLVYAIEYEMWGLNAKFFHAINLLSHLIATACVYRFFLRFTKDAIATAIITFLFALHPMHTSVAMWASQLKTSMFVTFYMLGLIQYLRFSETGSNRNRIYTLLYFILSLLSKPSAVTFPIMLLLLDYFREPKITYRLLLQKAPYFVLSLIFGIVTLYTHWEFGDNIFQANREYSLLNKILIMNYSVVFYIEKFFIPMRLSSIYPYPENTALLPLKYYLLLPVIPLLGWLVYKSGRYRKEVIFGLAFFLISLLPELRLLPTGDFPFANRYSYLSYCGLFYIIARFYSDLSQGKLVKLNKTRMHFHIVLVLFCLFLLYRTNIRAAIWENSYTLFSDVIKKYPKYPDAYNQRGLAHYSVGQIDSALADISRAIKLKPDFPEGYNNRAAVLMEAGRFTEAKYDLMRAIELNYKDAVPYNNLGKCFVYEGAFDRALGVYNAAIRYNPAYKEAYLNRAMILLYRKDSAGAYRDAMKAQELGMKEAGKFLYKNFSK